MSNKYRARTKVEPGEKPDSIKRGTWRAKDLKRCQCQKCGQGFGLTGDAEVVALTYQVNFMRGDDIMHFYHPYCWKETT